MKSNAEYLSEVKDWPHILKMRAGIIGQLAIAEARRTGQALIQADGVEVEVEITEES